VTSQSRRVILCVDDDPDALETRKSILTNAGYDVLAVPDAQHALQAFNSENIQLVVIDYFLPGITGTEVAAEMKRVRPNLPIVLVSGITENPQGLEHVDLFVTRLEYPTLFLAEIAAVLASSATPRVA
jgi:CheY-like chemotaxis protein